MEPEIASVTPEGDFFVAPPELPPLKKRWTTSRKAGVIVAVRRGELSLDEACRRYRLSVDEFVAWERDYDRYGVPGLRTTRYQIYRQTETKAG
ncbi:MAG: DUF1153 domain-containing protein [Deltaproteobacteria bacterium]|nr:DUF1153 domain-containing protein [Deltaproteobacteria bacterium]